MFGLSGENLTKRLRSMAFKAILSQEVGFFDMQENNVGILCTKLATEASAVQGVSASCLFYSDFNYFLLLCWEF